MIMTGFFPCGMRIPAYPPTHSDGIHPLVPGYPPTCNVQR